MFKYFVGIDVSSFKFNVCIINKNKEIKETYKFKYSYFSFISLTQILSEFGNKKEIIIGIESTGNYHINIFSFLTEKGFNVLLINPLIVKKFSQAITLRKTKTDKVDAFTIAKFLLFNKDKLPQNPSSQHLKSLAREREKLAKEIAKTKTRIKQIVFNIFFEFGEKYPIFSKTSLLFLLNVPSARIARKLGEKKVREIINKISRGKGMKTEIKPKGIIHMANNTISVDDKEKEIILKSLIRRLFHLKREIQTLSEELLVLASQKWEKEIKIITSIKGIGVISAINFMAEIQDIKRFNSSKKLTAYAGIDPIIKESGKFKGRFKISKRGNPHIRRALWNMCFGATIYENTIGEFLRKKKQEGMKHKKAMIATCNKLLRIIFTLLNRETTFHPHHSTVQHCYLT